MIHIYDPYYEQWFDNSRTRDDYGLSDIFVDHLKEMNDPRLTVIAHPAIESVWKGIHDEQPYRMPYPENQEIYNAENLAPYAANIVDPKSVIRTHA